MSKIKTVCVIGAGVMGSGIAAVIANSKTPVILLDIAGPTSDKNQIVNSSYQKLLMQKPAPLLHPDYARYITTGNLTDDLNLIRKADLIIEAVTEKLEIKHQLYELIAGYLKRDAIITSNTSTLPLSQLTGKLSADLRERFFITHFFNPPRYMELIELVAPSLADRAVPLLKELRIFLTKAVGKTIVVCNDTPGFIANRAGCFLLELAVRRGIQKNLNPVIIDHIFAKYLGFPNTGLFGLYDLIGHDVMSMISQSLIKALPAEDNYHKIYQPDRLLQQMLDKGLIGRKAGAGFYKLSKDASGKYIKQIIDFLDLSYTGIQTALPEYKDLKEILTCKDEYSDFILEILNEFFAYVSSMVPGVTSEQSNIDKAMRLGYNLKYGPFELQDLISDSTSSSSLSPSSSLRKPYILDQEKTVIYNGSASLKVIEDHYVYVIHTKNSVLDVHVFYLLEEAIDYVNSGSKALYMTSRPDRFSNRFSGNFCVGADLYYLKGLIENKDYKGLENFLSIGQKALMALKHSTVKVIACAQGLALGGGCEILLHSSVVMGHQNMSAGLVELGVGLIPGWGGVKEMFVRGAQDEQTLIRNLSNILLQNKTSSPEYFKQDYSTRNVLVNMNRDFILDEAFEAGIQDWNHNNSGYTVHDKIELPSLDLASSIDTTKIDELQLDVLQFFQKIIDKKTITENELLELEREKFLELAFKPVAISKIDRILARH